MTTAYTLQDVFDRVYVHLLQQGRKSILSPPDDWEGDVTEPVTCAYRGEGGARCAIGCLIPDELYTPEMEGRRTWEVVVRSALAQAGYASVNLYILYELQYIHDSCPVHKWPDALADFAKTYKLTVPPSSRRRRRK